MLGGGLEKPYKSFVVLMFWTPTPPFSKCLSGENYIRIYLSRGESWLNKTKIFMRTKFQLTLQQPSLVIIQKPPGGNCHTSLIHCGNRCVLFPMMYTIPSRIIVKGYQTTSWNLSILNLIYIKICILFSQEFANLYLWMMVISCCKLKTSLFF